MMEAQNGKQQPATEEGKIFVGGLSWETTKESLRAHFEQFGEVADATVMVENATRKPRGFGFVTFADPSCVAKVMNFSRKKGNDPVQHHIIDGKQVDPKPATVKGGTTELSGKKVFVGGIGHDVTDDDVHSYFGQYGTVVETDLKVDKATNRKKGFCFVTFDDESAVEKIVQIHFHQLKGKTVECKVAQPRNQMQSRQQPQQQQFYGGGAPYGGYGTVANDWGAAGGAYSYAQQQQQHQQHYHQQQQQQYTPTGSYMRGGYAPQNTTGGYHMGRGDPSATPTGVPHQAHMNQGYGRGHDATAYSTGPATGYGQTAAAGGAAYGAPQAGYNYESMPQVGAQPTATPYGATQGYGDTTVNAGYQMTGGAPPKQPKPTYNNYY